MSGYRVASLPAVLVIDPITGAPMRAWHGFLPADRCAGGGPTRASPACPACRWRGQGRGPRTCSSPAAGGALAGPLPPPTGHALSPFPAAWRRSSCHSWSMPSPTQARCGSWAAGAGGRGRALGRRRLVRRAERSGPPPAATCRPRRKSRDPSRAAQGRAAQVMPRHLPRPPGPRQAMARHLGRTDRHRGRSPPPSTRPQPTPRQDSRQSPPLVRECAASVRCREGGPGA